MTPLTIFRRKFPAVALSGALILAGCSREKFPILNPNGYVGEMEFQLLWVTLLIMAAIVIPVIILTFWVLWRYRASADANYDPDFDHSPVISAVTIFVPFATIAGLGWANWDYTHSLDPYRPLGKEQTPYEIDAISLDYKWLFIYPEDGLATVNELVAPVDTPVTIRVTSDPVMTSIFIPGLISQIYAMPGSETRSNFLATEPRVMDGANAQFNGPDFANQRFKTHLLTKEDFKSWVEAAKTGKPLAESPGFVFEPVMSFERYQTLAKQSPSEPIMYFGNVEPNLFEKIVRIYSPHYQMNPLPTEVQYVNGE